MAIIPFLNNAYFGGDVGIGTESPSSLLHLESASSPTLRIKDTTQGATLLAFSQDSNSHIGTYSNHPLVFDTNSAERIRIDASGNVGIGTASPDALLDIGTNNIITLDDTGSSTGFVGFGAYNNGTTNIAQGFSYYGFGLEIDRPNQNISFNSYASSGVTTGGTNILVLKRDGNVGIGTDSPDTKLTVSGEILSENSNGGYFISTRVPSGSSRPTLNFYGTALDINYATGYAGVGASTAVSILTNGNVGIGTTTPSTILDVGDGQISGVDVLYGDSSNSLLLAGYDKNSLASSFIGFYTANGTSSGERMRIDASGNVGIGTATPSSNLEIVGNGGTVLDVQGSQGQLFSVTDSLTGSIFAVSDISGVPILDVNSNGTSYFDGSVGIGTSSPGAKLEVSGSSGAITGTGITYLNNADDAFSLVINNAGTSAQNDRGVFDARVGGSSVFRVNNSGNVGIGTVSPTNSSNYHTLDIRGTNGGQIIAGRGSYQDFFMYTDSSGANIGALNDIRFEAGSNGGATPKMIITSAGNVGIGTTAPLSQLSIGSNAITTKKPTVVIADGVAGGSLVIRGLSPILSFDRTGASPENKILMDGVGLEFKTGTLDAEGDVDFKIKLDGKLQASAYTQGFLQSDASGNIEISGGGTLPGGPYLPLAGGTLTGGLTGTTATFSSTLNVTGVSTLANVGYLGDGLGSVQYTLQSSNTGYATIDFGDVADSNIGRLSYSHVDDSFLIRTNNATALTLDSSQNATFAGTVASTGLSVNAGAYHKVIATFPSTYETNLQIGQQLNINTEASSDTVTFAHTGLEAVSDFIFTVGGNQKLKIEGSGDATFAGDINLGDDLNFTTNGFADISNTGTGSMRFKPSSQTLALTLTGANATFAGNVNLENFISIDSIATGSPYVDFKQDGTQKAYIQYADVGDDLVIQTDGQTSFRTNGNTTALTLDASQNATFAGDVLALGFDIGTDSTSIIQETNRMKFANSIANDAGGFDFYTRKTDSAYVNALQILGTGNATFATQAFSSATSSGDGSSTLTTKGYVDGLITGATIYRGAWNPDVALNSGYGNPDLSTATQTSGYYYICSADGAATPNGTTTEPNTWNTGDWVIWNDDIGVSGEWQKIDNSSVLSGVGTGTFLSKWAGAASVTDSETLENSSISDTGSAVTIANPTTITGPLTVNMDANDTVFIKSAGTNAAAVFAASGDELYLGGGDSYSVRFPASSNYALFDNSSARVGIGTGSPDAILETSKSAAGNTIGALLTNTNGSGTADSVSLSFGLGRSADSYIRAVDAIKLLKEQQWTGTASTVDAALVFSTVANEVVSERMRIDSAGNVGINDSVGNGKLAIKTSGTFTTDSNDGDFSGVNIVMKTTNTALNAVGSGMVWLKGGSDARKVAAITNYTYGDADQSGLNFYVQTTSSGSAASLTEAMRIDSAGNVGIGVTAPSEKLEVVGNVLITSALLSNQENTDVDTGTETVANVLIASYTAAFFDFVIKNGTNVRSGTVYACHDGTSVVYTETSTNDLGDTSDVTLSVDISGVNMRLLATTTSDNWSVKSLIRAI